MAVGNIYETDHVNSILAAGRADLVALARPHLIDPMWTLRAAAGQDYRRVARAAALSRRHGPARAQPAARSGAEGVRLARATTLSITGGGTGHRRAPIARALGRRGREAHPGRATAGEARGSRLRRTSTPWSPRPTSPTARRSTACFAIAREAQGPISILVNNAGAAESAPFAKVTEEAWRRTMAVNLDALLHCCQAALARPARRRGGADRHRRLDRRPQGLCLHRALCRGEAWRGRPDPRARRRTMRGPASR